MTISQKMMGSVLQRESVLQLEVGLVVKSQLYHIL